MAYEKAKAGNVAIGAPSERLTAQSLELACTGLNRPLLCCKTKGYDSASTKRSRNQLMIMEEAVLRDRIPCTNDEIEEVPDGNSATEGLFNVP